MDLGDQNMTGPDEYTMWLERERSGRNADQLLRSYDLLLERVKRIDPMTIAETTDGRYQAEGVPGVVIPSLHSWFVLDLLPYRIRAGHAELDSMSMKVLLMHHIIAAADNQGTAVRVMGQWIDARQLQHGAVLGAHFGRTSTEILDRFFSLGHEERLVRALRWGGVPSDLGDCSFVFRFFPRLPLALLHWSADDEFPAYAKILFDVSASNYMPTHGLTALTEFLIHRLAE
jgi:hypothetical protein